MEKITKEKTENISSAISGVLDNDYQISVNLVRRKQPIDNFIMLFQEATLKMLDGNMSKNSLRIFVYMLGKLQYSNHIGVDQYTIAEENGISIPYAKKAISELKKANILISYKDVQDARRNVYIINPIIAWRGKAKNRNKALKSKNLTLNLFSNNNAEIG